MSDYIVGLDIGSRNICATMSIEDEEFGFEVLDFVCKESSIKKQLKSSTNSFDLVVNDVRECLSELEQKTNQKIKVI